MSNDEPQELIQELRKAGFDALDREIVDRIIARGADCAPLLVGVLHGFDEDPVKARALALLGEIGELALLHEIVAFFAEDDTEDAVTDAAEWAFHRVAVRHPEGALQVIAELAATADPTELSALSKHLSMMPDVPGRVATLLGFAGRLPDFDRDERALMVTGMIITAMFLEGPRGELAASIRKEHGAHLNRESLKVLEEVETELTASPYKPGEEEESSIYDLVCEGFTMEEEAPGTFVREEPKLGRNDPCWCGSGKKYKKCHLAADGER